MTEWLRAHIALPEDLSSILSTQVRRLTTACNPSSREIRHIHVHTHTLTPTNT